MSIENQGIEVSREVDSSICLLSTADWDAPLWTNKQYMARELAKAYDVLYVGSVGLRRPTLTRRDLSRIVARLAPPSASTGKPPPPRVTVRSPKMLPWHGGAASPVNRRLLGRICQPWSSAPAENKVLWTYSPVVHGLDEVADRTVYHAVDLLGSYPGIDERLIDRAERRLAKRCDVAIGSSEVVAEHLERIGFRRVVLWSNVADTEPYATISGVDRQPGRIVFGGNITPYKIDLGILRQLAERYPDLDIVMCGPTDEGGAGEWREVAELRRLGVRFTGTRSVAELAEEFAAATVGVIPYAINEYTSGVNPLKMYEYLAAGLAVVSTPIPSVQSAAQQLEREDLVVVETTEQFVEAVVARSGLPSQEVVKRRRDVADEHSWTKRGEQARDLIRTLG